MIKKIMLKYYFWKLKKKKISFQSVALKLNVSIEKVINEYDIYMDPFRRIKVEPIISFIAVCISLCSSFIAVETLNEMRKERELAYKPDLRVYENDVSLYWNDEGWEIKRGDNYTRQYLSNEENILYGVYLNVDNIGTGNAKDIKFDWNYKDNIMIFDSFLKGSGVEVSLLESENVIEIEHKNKFITQSKIDENDVESYISQNTQKRVLIPSVYLELLTVHCYENMSPSSEIEYGKSMTIKDFPELYLTISYQDIQGSIIKKQVKIGFEPVVYNKEVSGEGSCTLRVRNLGENILG